LGGAEASGNLITFALEKGSTVVNSSKILSAAKLDSNCRFTGQ